MPAHAPPTTISEEETSFDELVQRGAFGEEDDSSMVSMSTVINIIIQLLVLILAFLHSQSGVLVAEAPSPICNVTFTMDVIPRTSIEGSLRLQRWVHQRSVPWRASSFVQPYFHPIDVEKQVTSRLPPSLLRDFPQWSCTLSNPELHALQCTWQVCASNDSPLPTNATEVQALQEGAIEAFTEALGEDAMVLARPLHASTRNTSLDGIHTVVVHFSWQPHPLPFLCDSPTPSAPLLNSSAPSPSCDAAQCPPGVLCWTMSREMWQWEMQALWNEVVAHEVTDGNGTVRNEVHTIVWPQWDNWWTRTDSPLFQHAFGIVQRLAAVGVTLVSIGSNPRLPTASRRFGMLPVRLAPLEVIEQPSSVDAAASTAVMAASPSGEGRVDTALWVHSPEEFVRRLGGLQSALQSSRRQGLGVASAQFEIASLFCEACVLKTQAGQPLWDTMDVDATARFLSHMQCG